MVAVGAGLAVALILLGVLWHRPSGGPIVGMTSTGAHYVRQRAARTLLQRDGGTVVALLSVPLLCTALVGICLESAWQTLRRMPVVIADVVSGLLVVGGMLATFTILGAIVATVGVALGTASAIVHNHVG